MKAEQRFKQNFEALFFFLNTKIHELERRRVFYIILIISIYRLDIFLPRKACGGMLLRAVIFGVWLLRVGWGMVFLRGAASKTLRLRSI